MQGLVEAVSRRGLSAQKKAIVPIKLSQFEVEEYSVYRGANPSDRRALIERLDADRERAPVAVALSPDGAQTVSVPFSAIYVWPEIGPMGMFPGAEPFKPKCGDRGLLETLLVSAREEASWGSSRGIRFDSADDCVSRIAWWRLPYSLDSDADYLWGDSALITVLREETISNAMASLSALSTRINVVTSRRHLDHEFMRFLLGGFNSHQDTDTTFAKNAIVSLLTQEQGSLSLLIQGNTSWQPFDGWCEVEASSSYITKDRQN